MLKKQYDEKLAQKEELRKKSEEMELKLERAGMLVSGLAGEKARWEETVQVRWAVTVAVLLNSPPASRGPSPCPLRGNGHRKSKSRQWEPFPPLLRLGENVQGMASCPLGVGSMRELVFLRDDRQGPPCLCLPEFLAP